MRTSPPLRRQGVSLLAGVTFLLLSLLGGTSPVHAQTTRPSWFPGSREKLVAELTAKHGAAQKAQLERGLDQVADFWRAEDGDAAAFEELARANYAGDP